MADTLDDVVVETERDFTAARSRVESGAVDCVVADHGPGFDGVSLLEQIRQTRPSFPVVLLPESNDGSVARRAVAADVTGFVPKTEQAALELVVEEIADVVPAGRGDRVRMPIHDRTATEEKRLKELALDEAPVGVTIGDATVPDEPLIYSVRTAAIRREQYVPTGFHGSGPWESPNEQGRHRSPWGRATQPQGHRL